MSGKKRLLLPFTAIVGQEEMKKALILNVINPKIGGVLIRGEKGTAKSTAVRGLAELLPEIEVVKNCPFSCNPNNHEEMCDACRHKWEKGGFFKILKRKVMVINLPLGATEDRVVGSIDFESAIRKGMKAFEPGLLASANRGILYIDEVNLLDDHIADLLLDSAALGVNVVEREGIEISHPANFTLIGTMNPEEGEIRPQLLDRFGLQVTVNGLSDINDRTAIVDIINNYDRDSGTYIQKKYRPYQEALAEKIVTAIGILNDVKIHRDLIEAIASICIEFDIKTHRAEVATLRTSLTIAAFDGRREVLFDDIREALNMTLPHRMRRKPFDPPVLDKEQLDNRLDEWKKKTHKHTRKEHNIEVKENSGSYINLHGDVTEEEKIFEIENQIDPKLIKYLKRKRIKNKSMLGRRIRTIFSRGGTYVRTKIPKGKISDIAIDATIRAAAPHVRSKTEKNNGIMKINREDIREKVRIGKISTYTVFVVDTSGSMSASERIKSARGAVFSMMVDSYQKRDKVGLVAFSGKEGKLVLPLCSSIDWGIQCLKSLSPGGSTPLCSGLQKGLEILLLEKLKNSEAMLVLVLISDGNANVPTKADSNIYQELVELTDQAWINKIHMIFIDVEQSEISDYHHGHFYKQLLMSRMSHYSVGQLSAGIIKKIVYGEKEMLLS
jgi:magnesium chelatase subunit D